MTAHSKDSNLTHLLMIATPDPVGTIRFPPLLSSNLDSSSGLPKGVYGGHPLLSPSNPSLFSTAQMKTRVSEYLTRIFGQNMEFLWMMDPHFQETVSWNPLPHEKRPPKEEDQGNSQDPVCDQMASHGLQAELRLIRVTVPLAQKEWLSFPDILRSLPKTRFRIPYLRMFQILMGQHFERTEAVDTEQLKKILTKDENH